MKRWAKFRTVAAAGIGLTLVVGILASPVVAQLEAPGSPIVLDSRSDSLGATHGRALYLSVDGVGDLTIGDGAGYLAFGREQKETQIPVLPSGLLVACGPETVGIQDTDQCLDRGKLAENGISVSADGVVSEDSLFQAGLTTRRLVSSESVFPVPLENGTTFGSGVLAPASAFLNGRLAEAAPGGATPAANPQGFGRAVGVLVPNLASAEAVCDGRAGSDNVSAQRVALPLPDPLAPVVTGGIGLASCDLIRQSGGSRAFPVLRQSFGEAVVDVTATQTIVGSVPLVNDVLDTLIGAAPAGPVQDTLQTLRDQLEAAPLLSVRVAPGEELVTTSDAGVTSSSETGDVVIDVLGGVAEIRVSSAVSEASVLNGVSSANAECAFVTVSSILLNSPVRVECPSNNLTLLGGLPAPIGDTLAITIQTGQTTTSQQPRQASATSSVLSISAFNTPLPQVRLQLASSGAFALVQPTQQMVGPGMPSVLPRTGAFSLGGFALLGLAAYLRRRVVG